MKPIELYRIVMGTDIWTLTSADEDQTYDAGDGDERYFATAMGRTDINQKNELAKANIDVTIPLEHSLAIMLLSSYNEQIISLTIFNNNEGDVKVRWKGRLSSIKPSDAALTMNFESIWTSLRRAGLRAKFQKSCRHALYGRGCLLDPADFATAGVLNAITGNVLTVPEAASQADGYFIGGMVRAPSGAFSYVVNHVGTQLTLQRVSFALASVFAESGPGVAIQIYPGCDHTRLTCKNKFNNLLNYGGFDWIPNKNPMGGSSIV